jgi:hypothetical protein
LYFQLFEAGVQNWKVKDEFKNGSIEITHRTDLRMEA